MEEYRLLDTRAWDAFLEARMGLINRYGEIETRYGQIVEALAADWKGRGAKAFQEDSRKAISNLAGIGDILETMCDTLRDCREVFGECDTSLGRNNRDAVKSE